MGPAFAAVLAVSLLAGCGPRSGRRVERVEGGDVRALRRLAVPPFVDARGKGAELSRAVLAGLPPLLREAADERTVARAMAARNKDGEAGLGFESLEILRGQAGADGVVLGRMASDWSSVSVTVHETELGDPVVRAVLVPRGKDSKAFKDPAEAAAEVLKLLSEGR